ncbi:hypothetical protein L1987_87544 [Smallanthus sonchifolius]|nr:hypothetical protein L1987_87544 [Smallanthus sonchifolius]
MVAEAEVRPDGNGNGTRMVFRRRKRFSPHESPVTWFTVVIVVVLRSAPLPAGSCLTSVKMWSVKNWSQDCFLGLIVEEEEEEEVKTLRGMILEKVDPHKLEHNVKGLEIDGTKGLFLYSIF